MKRYSFCIILFLCLFIDFFAETRAQELSFELFSANHGLANSEVTAIFQDSRGYIWFGTNGGISCYDGFSFKTFSIRDGLVYNAVLDFEQDQHGNLWIATRDGISKFDYKNDQDFSFENYNKEGGFPGSSFVNEIVIDKEDRIFCTAGNQLAYFDDNKFHIIHSLPELKDDEVVSLYVDNENYLWIGTKTGVLKLMVFGKKPDFQIKRMFTKEVLPVTEGIVAIAEDHAGNMWFSSRGVGVCRFDGKTFTTFFPENGLCSRYVSGFVVDRNNRIWMKSLEGLSMFDGDAFTNYYKNNGLPHNFVTSLLLDREDNLWIGTYGKGAARLKSEYFVNYSRKSGMKETSVFSIIEWNNREILVGTSGGGVCMIENNTLTCPDYFTSIENEYVYTMARDGDNRIWIGTRGKGIFIFDGEKLIRPPEIWNLPKARIFSLFKDEQGNMWIGTEGYGVFCFDGKKTRKISEADSVHCNYVTDINQTPDGNLWFGSSVGLVKFRDGAAELFNERDGLQDHYIFCVRPDSAGNLWIATRRGFSIYNEKEGFRNYDYSHGLSDDNVYFIQHDQQGSAWIGTGKGIDVFTDKVIANFTMNQGLIENETNGRASLLDSNGHLWFGTVEGLSCFVPENYSKKVSQPLINIEKIWIGDSLFVGDAANKLSHTCNELSFEFKGIYFSNTSELKYQYRLLGFQNTWTESNSYTRAHYTNLFPGTYTFQVKAVIGDNVESSKTASFQFQILPPFWKKPWFIYLAIISIFLILYFLYRLRTYQLKKNQIALEKEVAKRTAELERQKSHLVKTLRELRTTKNDLEEANTKLKNASKFKSEFLANMSHEIRTPMNGVIGLTEILLDTPLTDQQHQFLSMVKNSSTQLLTLLNDILDLSKIEAGQIFLENTTFNLRPTVENVADLVIKRVEDKNIELNIFIHNEVPVHLVGDPARLKQVLVNLVGNAIKFTEGGEVTIQVKLKEKTDKYAILLFSVKDSGVGIAQDRQKAIFESFTQADASTTRKFGGTGLGLTISRQLVKMMGGDIWLDSTLGAGSTFHFTGKFLIQQGEFTKEEVLPTDVRGLKVLAVDDNATNRLILQEMLHSFKGYPRVVESGKQVIEILKKEDDYELIISDFQMPEMDGCDLVRLIRELQPYKDTPVIMLTSLGKNACMIDLEKLQKIWTITKPVKKSQMFDAMITALGTSFRPKNNRQDHAEKENYGESLLKIDKKGRILLAEDNLVNQQVTMEFLNRVGIKPDLAENGEIAIDALRKHSYDIILMDVQMPVMDGFTATQKIRKELGMADIPIIALTAHAMKGDREKCFDAGMDDYLSKPIDPDELYRVLHSWLSKAHKNN